MATLSALSDTVVLTGDSSAALAEQASQTFFDSAPVVVIAAEGESLRGASAAAALGVPVLIDGPQVSSEIDRLGSEVALVLGAVSDPGIDVVVPKDDNDLAALVGASAADGSVAAGNHIGALTALDADNPQLLAADGPATVSSTSAAPVTARLESDRDELPATQRPEATSGVVVLSSGDDRDTAAVGTVLASGAHVVIVPGGDPRSTSESVSAMAEMKPETAVGVGPEFIDAETLKSRLQVASTGAELPGGGQLVLPGKTYVALYGHPGSTALGVLGEQDAPATIKRAAAIASEYDSLVDQPVVPALEIIATVASAQSGRDGNYSNEVAPEALHELVDLAGKNGQYVVLDLQPGRTDFLTQAKLYEELLVLPHVGLALDPEWRIKPNQVHLRQIGHVEVAEVNQVATWLADLVKENNLPQKMLILHQFQIQMLRDVNNVDQSRSEIAVLIHVDGQGPQPTKQTTWRTLHNNASTVQYWGWKNFYDEDIPGPLSPSDTITTVDPVPDFISYQ
ncbi:MAG: hypothetical protein Q4P15_09615 [Propionibacteriaceae bacterium]|nr:hypothetical protein [Propionibacteriaceae bacterium]